MIWITVLANTNAFLGDKRLIRLCDLGRIQFAYHAHIDTADRP